MIRQFSYGSSHWLCYNHDIWDDIRAPLASVVSYIPGVGSIASSAILANAKPKPPTSVVQVQVVPTAPPANANALQSAILSIRGSSNSGGATSSLLGGGGASLTTGGGASNAGLVDINSNNNNTFLMYALLALVGFLLVGKKLLRGR